MTLRALRTRENDVPAKPAAKAAGLCCVAVPNRMTRDLGLSRADAIVDSFLEIDLDALALFA